jgi:Xaa-Pro aminopeptidase
MYRWPSIDQGALRSHRFEQATVIMRAHGLDHLLLTSADQIRYVTDFRSQLTNEPDWFAVVVDADASSDAFVPYIDELILEPDPTLPLLRAMRPLPSWAPALAHPACWVTAIGAELARRGARRVGYDTLDAALLDSLRHELPSMEFVSIGTELYLARQVKHPLEVTLIEAACRVNTGALNAALAAGQAGATDHDVLAAAMHYQQAAGAEFVTHSVCNLRKGSGDWFAYGARLREGDPYFFDIGCYGVGGYASDAARVGFVGEPHPKVRHAYEHLLSAHQIAQDTARPGTKASAIAEQVNKYLTSHGLGRTPYAVGHGVGLRICELPTIYSPRLMDRDTILQAGQVIALEPETSVEVDGELVVLKVEDNFAVTSDGLRQLTIAPAEDELIP